MQPTVLASVPVDAVDDALLVPRALVVDHRALRSPEEALAALARYHAIVDARGLVAADFAGNYFDLRCNEKGDTVRLVKGIEVYSSSQQEE